MVSHRSEIRQIYEPDGFVGFELIVIESWVLGPDPLEYEQLVLSLLLHNQVFPANDGEPVFALGLFQADDLIGFARTGIKQLDRNLPAHFEGLGVVHYHLIGFRNQKCVHGGQIDSHLALIILVIDAGLELVVVFAAVDRKVGAVDPVRNREHHAFAEHHLVAAHIIIHTIFKLGHQSFLIDEIEVHILISGHLNPNIALYIVQKPSHFQVEIFLPRSFFCVWVEDLLEKEHSARTLDDQSFTLKEYHLTHIKIRHYFKPVIRLTFPDIFRIILNCEYFSLPVENINFIFLRIIKALLRIILPSTLQLPVVVSGKHLPFLVVVYQMVVAMVMIME